MVFLNYTVSTKFSTELLNLVLNLVLLVNLAFETGYRDLLLVCYPVLDFLARAADNSEPPTSCTHSCIRIYGTSEGWSVILDKAVEFY